MASTELDSTTTPGGEADAGFTPPQTTASEETNLKLVYNLSVIDQSVSRKYVRRMFIFDFPDTSEDKVEAASGAIRQGLEVALKHYPFLTGKVGPARDPKRNLVQLRYGDTDELRSVTPDIFKIRVHPEDLTFGGYEELCRRGMPVSHWAMENFCASPQGPGLLPEWKPAFTLQANFLEEGALVLCVAFQHSVADGTSIGLFVDKFAAGIRGDTTVDNVGEYSGANLESITENAPKRKVVDCFPEWNFDERQKLPHRHQWDSYVITMSAQMISELKHRVNYCVRRRTLSSAWVSTIDCISALMWVYISRARLVSFKKKTDATVFTTAVSIRDRLGNTVEPTQFGNLFSTVAVEKFIQEVVPRAQSASAKAEKPLLCNASLLEIASCAMDIREGISDVTKAYTVPRLRKLAQLEDPTKASTAAARACLPTKTGVKLGSLVDFGADTNFGIPGTAGDGRPRFCRKPWMMDGGMVNILPRRGGTHGDAPWEILVCLPAHTIEKLVHNDALGPFIDSYVQDKDPRISYRRPAEIPGRPRLPNIDGW
ncbi:hypothetical protein JX266_011110 [Neoarthrinium moseri]|nr:hypothetical protein JX266_011110 [Neoarthrinium moseri]